MLQTASKFMFQTKHKKDYNSVMDMFKYLKPRDFVAPQALAKGSLLSVLRNI